VSSLIYLKALSAVRAFLPMLAAADQQLSQLSEEEKKRLQLDLVDDDSQDRYVEMNVALVEQDKNWSSDSGEHMMIHSRREEQVLILNLYTHRS
jgi:hypothetical protein